MAEKVAIIRDGSIIWFNGEYDWLSNFYPCSIDFKGLVYPNAEAAFQAQKVDILMSSRPEEFSIKDKEFFTTLTGREAKPLGMGKRDKKFRMTEEELKVWNPIALSTMEEVVRAKYTQNDNLKEKLLATQELGLIEGNNWGDNFYGITLALEHPDAKNPYTKRMLKRDENGEKLYVLSQPENENNNHLGKILMKIRKELKEEF